MMDPLWAFGLIESGWVVMGGLILRRYAQPRVAWLVVLGHMGIAVLLARILGPTVFEFMRLLSWGLFVFTPLLLCVGGWAVRRDWPRGSRWAWAAALGIIAIGVDAFVIEPRSLVVTTHTFATAKVSRPWRIVLLADLQTDRLTNHERRVFETIRKLDPDLILMAGDYLQIDNRRYRELMARYRDYWRALPLAARHGIVAVPGNMEKRGWEALFAYLPVETVTDSRTIVFDEIEVRGLTLEDSFNPQGHPGVPSDRYQIVLGHGPDFALGAVVGDLLLAGHTHGGQVQLPFWGPLVTFSRVPRAWASGRTQLPSGQTLIVSRGVGHERDMAPRLRFLCRPELVVIDLEPATSP